MLPRGGSSRGGGGGDDDGGDCTLGSPRGARLHVKRLRRRRVHETAPIELSK